MIKRRFARTNKRKYTAQLAAAEIRERFMQRLKQRIINNAQLLQVRQHRTRRRKRPQAESDEDMVESRSFDSTQRYDIADTTKEKENILEWVHTNHSDIATKVWHFTLRVGTDTHTDTVTYNFRTLFEG